MLLMRIFTRNILVFSLLFSLWSSSFASPLTEYLTRSITDKIAQSMGETNISERMKILYGDSIEDLSWNPNVWTKQLDLTGVAWANSADGLHRRATLITPRHLLIATHYSLSVGNDVMFLDKNNEIVSRKITVKKTISLPPNIAQNDLKTVDIDLLEIESDVPANITYYPLFDARTLSSRIDDTFPVISLNQKNEARILPITYLGDFSTSIRNTYKGKLLSNGVFEDFTQTGIFADFRQPDLIKGDSSNPIFAVMGDQLILFSHHSRTASSTNFSFFINTLNSEIADLGSTYRVTVADVSSFTPSLPELDTAPESLSNNDEASNSCQLSSEFQKCASLKRTFAGMKKTLSCLGMPMANIGGSQTSVKRSTTLEISLGILGEELVKPTRNITLYRDVRGDKKLLQMTQTGIQYDLLSRENKYFRPMSYTTRAEAYHMLLQSVCISSEKDTNIWEKNLYDTVSKYGFTTQSWEQFQPERHITHSELLYISERVIKYKHTYGGCSSDKNVCK